MQAGDVEPRERHRRAGNRLVAADQHDERVEQVAARDQLDRVGDHLAADERGRACPREPIVMPSEIETVLNSIGVPPAARMPALTDAGELAQVEVARADLDPGVGDADERPLQIRAR